jgi:putative glycerol-1-phosphate prenyltransferase
MAKSILKSIQNASKKGEKLLAVLLDPDKVAIDNIASISNKIAALNAHFIFVGGSFVASGLTELFVVELKKHSKLPVILFPGDYSQVTNKAQALLFLSLISGRNPEYLIEQQIKAVPFLQNSSLEIIPTGYVLIDGGTQSSVLKISKTSPIEQNNIELIVATAKAGEYKGKELIYLEAGSGATMAVNPKIIAAVKKQVKVPVIVGGGIKTKQQMLDAFNSGADVVVIGTAVEHNLESLNTFVS